MRMILLLNYSLLILKKVSSEALGENISLVRLLAMHGLGAEEMSLGSVSGDRKRW